MGYTYKKELVKMKFTQKEKINIILIIISTISIITSFILSVNQIAWISIILCGIPIFKECITGLVREFDINKYLYISYLLIHHT